MRRDHVLAVSSATLFLSTVFAPCHFPVHDQRSLVAGEVGQGVLISEFYPCGLCDDEYLVLENAFDAPVCLRNWTITDGEGELRFTGEVVIAAGARLIISWNSTSYQEAFGRFPDIGLDRPEVLPFVSRTGTFRMADAGDSISLLDDAGAEADFVVYGDCSDVSASWSGDGLPVLRKGEVARRLREGGPPLDSDTVVDWLHFREFRYGYTDLSPISASVGPGMLTAFASPDCGLASVADAIESAKSSLRLCAYEFSSGAICSAVLSAITRGVAVSLLVDGAPAGGMDSAQIACLSVLARSGAHVKVLKGNASADAVQHVGPMHAKYIVSDERRLVVLSENFVETGIPSDPFSGNRGWGVSVISQPLAEYMATTFDEDSRASRPDVIDWLDDPRFDPQAESKEVPAASFATGVMSPAQSSSSAIVTLMPSPDCSALQPFLCPMVDGSLSVLVEQFQADLVWKDRWTGETHLNPLVSAAKDALVRGAEVRVLLDSVWFNAEGNGEVAEDLNTFASSHGLDGEARLMDLSGPVSTLHNKGLLMDGRLTVVSSNNWGYSSFAKNRELAMVVDSEEVAEYFSSIFETDWEPDIDPPVADAGPDITLAVGESAVLDGSRSSDDRSVALWQWRLEGVGMLTGQGDRAEFTASRPGTQVVYLVVQDAWGNTGVDSVTIEVVGDGDTAACPGGRWLFPFAAIVGVLSSAAGVAAARKLNHRNRTSR